ncbi:MAG: hypothetical protein LBU65_17560 [Planctomycetaceae bacterium]|nr:hypothetical protein [Planctomycetaceae bacterium]
MPKSLCIFSLSVSVLLFLIFTLDLLFGFPFSKAGGLLMNLGFIAATAILGTYSYLTLRELR